MLEKTRALLCLTVGMLSLIGLGVSAEVDPDMDAVVAKALADPVAREQLETESLEIIQSDAEWGARYRAARILAGAASERCVAPLAAMLADPDAAQLARYALEPMPYPSVDAAFREALARDGTPDRLGLIASIGKRRDAAAVGVLDGFLADADPEVSAAAALALGKIASPESVAQIEPLLGADDPARRSAAAEGCLTAAERLYSAGNAELGHRLYEKLLAPGSAEPVRAGAFAGLLRAEPDRAEDLVLQALDGDDPLLSAIAVASVASLEGDQVSAEFAKLLPLVPEALQAPLLESIAQRRDGLDLPTIHGILQNDNESLRLVALRLVAEAGGASSVAPLCDLLGLTTSRDESQAIRETLRRLQGDDVNAAITEAMQAAPEPRRPDLIEVLARRGARDSWPALVAQTGVDSVRAAAFRALAELAEDGDFEAMLELLVGLQGDSGRAEAEEAVATVGHRLAAERGGLAVKSAQYGVAPDGPWADVTEKVAELVRDGSLTTEATNAQFGDPAPGVVKVLRVEYEANGVAKQAEIGENQTLTITADAPPIEAVAKVTTALDQAASPEAAASLLRVLGRLATPGAFDAVASRVSNADPVVCDAAIRVLADWPTAQAVDALAGIVETAEQPVHRSIAVRGCVRLLRSGSMPAVNALTIYDRLIISSQTVDDRRTILAGLADVVHPAALAPVHALAAFDDVRAEADLARSRIEEAVGVTDRFAPIFDGTSLNGWAGDPDLWRAEDGRILGRTVAERPLEANTFLTWEGGDVADFELSFRYRLEADSVNSGVQVRSERFDGYRVRGYQADIATDDWITGICYEEGGRGVLARRGEIATLNADGSRDAVRFADEQLLGASIRANDWNDYHVVAWGDQIVTRVNGRITHVVIDDAPEARDAGVLAFQLHVGPPMKVSFADVKLRRLPAPPAAE